MNNIVVRPKIKSEEFNISLTPVLYKGELVFLMYELNPHCPDALFRFDENLVRDLLRCNLLNKNQDVITIFLCDLHDLTDQLEFVGNQHELYGEIVPLKRKTYKLITLSGFIKLLDRKGPKINRFKSWLVYKYVPKAWKRLKGELFSREPDEIKEISESFAVPPYIKGVISKSLATFIDTLEMRNIYDYPDMSSWDAHMKQESIPIRVFREQYLKWCRQNGYKPLISRKMDAEMKKAGWTQEKIKIGYMDHCTYIKKFGMVFLKIKDQSLIDTQIDNSLLSFINSLEIVHQSNYTGKQLWTTYMKYNSLTTQEFREKYFQWCQKNKYKPLSANTLGKKMKKLGWIRKRAQIDCISHYIYIKESGTAFFKWDLTTVLIK